MFVRMPALVHQPRSGVAIARLLDASDLQAVGVSIEQSLKLLRRTVNRQIKKDRVTSWFSWQRAELFQKSFPVQPAVVRQGRRYPAGPKVNLPIRYVELYDGRDQLFLLLPDFGDVLYVPEKSLLKSILADAIRSHTALLSPHEIHRLWPDGSSTLRWLRLRLAREPGYHSGEQIRVLSSVAEPFEANGNLITVPGARDAVLALIKSTLVKRSCLVVGETGVGKSTLIKIASKELPILEALDRAERAAPEESAYVHVKPQPRKAGGPPRFWLTSAGRLIAGMRYLGQWQQRLEAVVAELADIDGLLVIENLLDLVSIGGSDPRDSLGAFLIPYLRSGSLRIVTEATPSELDACRRLLPELIDVLPCVHVEPMERAHEIELLRQSLLVGLQSTDIAVDDQLPECLARLCRQFQSHQATPGPSMRLAAELIGKRRQKNVAERWDKPWLLNFFSQRTGLPRALIDDSHPLEREAVSKQLAKDVIGQHQACHDVAGIVTRIKAAVNDPQKPFGCLLLCGPTGVGKTQLATSLARYLFGANESDNRRTPMTRLDMSEYAGAHAGFRFLNAADGNSSAWIQQIRTRPLSVLLLDEIEKASPEVFDILLSVLDEGRLTDRFGRTTSFRNTVILLTSNVGARSSTSLGFGDGHQIDYAAEARKAFKPEFFNRIDRVISFHSLDPNATRGITIKELNDLCQREGLMRYGRTLIWSDRLVDQLTRLGFQSELGARPLQQTIETLVVAPLATWIVENSPPQNVQLLLDWDSDGDSLTVKIGDADPPTRRVD